MINQRIHFTLVMAVFVLAVPGCHSSLPGEPVIGTNRMTPNAEGEIMLALLDHVVTGYSADKTLKVLIDASDITIDQLKAGHGDLVGAASQARFDAGTERVIDGLSGSPAVLVAARIDVIHRSSAMASYRTHLGGIHYGEKSVKLEKRQSRWHVVSESVTAIG